MGGMKSLARIISWAALGLILAGASAAARAADPMTQRTEFDSLMPGWQSKFSIEWKVQPEPGGTRLVYGRVFSHYGQFASPFRVLALAIDSSGKVVGQRVEPIPSGVPGFANAYFQVGRMPAAASYRVTVWDYNFIEGRGGPVQ